MIGPIDGEQWQFFFDEDEFLEAFYGVGAYGFDWLSADYENPLYQGYLVDENYLETEYYASIITYDENYEYWMFVDSEYAYC